MRRIDLIVVHCSASEWGNAARIDQWHRERGFKRIGYHYVILNGFTTAAAYKAGRIDCEPGTLEFGRDIQEIGAHVQGYNSDSVGICLIGVRQFFDEQLLTLRRQIDQIRLQFPAVKVVGHYELDRKKTCPNLDMPKLRCQFGLPETYMT